VGPWLSGGGGGGLSVDCGGGGGAALAAGAAAREEDLAARFIGLVAEVVVGATRAGVGAVAAVAGAMEVMGRVPVKKAEWGAAVGIIPNWGWKKGRPVPAVWWNPIPNWKGFPALGMPLGSLMFMLLWGLFPSEAGGAGGITVLGGRACGRRGGTGMGGGTTPALPGAVCAPAAAAAQAACSLGKAGKATAAWVL